MRKMNDIRKRVRSAYGVLTDKNVKINRYEIAFERKVKEFDLTPEELYTARKHGIWPSSYVMYDFDKWNIGQYLSERDMHKLNFSERGLALIFKDKRNLPLLFLKKSAHYLPSLNIAIENGRVQYVVENGIYQERDFHLGALLEGYLKKYNSLIYKPDILSGGHGRFLMSQSLRDEDLQRIQTEGNAIINNAIVNEEYAHRINPHSLNTIRVNFFKNKNGSIKVISMLHRFGATSDTRVDNVSSGGVAAGIDQETGKLMQAYTIRRNRIDLDTHPVTGQTITGFMIPDWNDKKRAIDELLNEVNYLEYGGLDIAFTIEGCKVIEINARPALRSMQFATPALIDEEFVEFLRLRGYDK